MLTESHIYLLSMSFLSIGLSSLASLTTAKIITGDTRPRLKESAYIIFVVIFCTFIKTIPRFITFSPSSQYARAVDHPHYTFYTVLGGILLDIFLLLYIYKLKSYSAKKTIIIASISSLCAFLTGRLATFVFASYFNLTFPWSRGQSLLGVSRSLSALIISILFALLLTKATGKIRKAINASPHIQTAFLLGAIVNWLVFRVATSAQYISIGTSLDFRLNLLLLVGAGVSILSFFLYMTYLIAKQKEAENNTLQFYLSEIEQQQAAMRKFKHDYQNILISLDSFISEGDIAGLKHYFATKVKPASDIIAKSDFALEALSKIKVKEIKSILIAKLTMAQNLGITVKFESDGEIEHIHVDSVVLVRMLGIILDNAIEELEALGEGLLLVGCFKAGTSVNFVIQNTCRANIPPFRQLSRPGFSTKGEGRGLGLSNLSELADACPNITLLANISEGNFTQKLIIGADA